MLSIVTDPDIAYPTPNSRVEPDGPVAAIRRFPIPPFKETVLVPGYTPPAIERRRLLSGTLPFVAISALCRLKEALCMRLLTVPSGTPSTRAAS